MNNKLEQFSLFLKNAKNDTSDLIAVESGDSLVSSLLGDKLKHFFKIYYRNKAGDLIGHWDINKEFKSSSLPIVWLSSEGSPYTVVARNADEFLSLVPFGTGLISRIPVFIKEYKRKPAIYVSPDEEFTKEVIQKEYDYQAKQFKGHEEMVDFITKELKIELCSDPLGTIKNALDSSMDLEKWISEKSNN